MDGTDVLDDPGGELIPGSEVPTVASLCFDGIRAYQVDDEDDGPILVVCDGVTTVEFACGLSRHSGSAAVGARSLAQAARDFAASLDAASVDATSLPGGQ